MGITLVTLLVKKIVNVVIICCFKQDFIHIMIIYIHKYFLAVRLLNYIYCILYILSTPFRHLNVRSC